MADSSDAATAEAWRHPGGAPGRRHRSGAQLADHLFPDIGLDRHLRRIDAVERQPSGAQSLVVAADTVLVQHLTRLDRSGGG